MLGLSRRWWPSEIWAECPGRSRSPPPRPFLGLAFANSGTFRGGTWKGISGFWVGPRSTPIQTSVNQALPFQRSPSGGSPLEPVDGWTPDSWALAWSSPPSYCSLGQAISISPWQASGVAKDENARERTRPHPTCAPRCITAIVRGSPEEEGRRWAMSACVAFEWTDVGVSGQYHVPNRPCREGGREVKMLHVWLD